MKKLIISVLFIFLSLSVFESFAQSKLKIGFIDSNELLVLMPERDSAKVKLEGHAKTLERQLISMSSEFENKYQEFITQQATMSELIKATKTKELQELQARIENFQQSAQQDLEMKEAELLNPIVSRAKKAIEDVAKENGFTYILDVASGALLFYEGDDILPLVRKKLGI